MGLLIVLIIIIIFTIFTFCAIKIFIGTRSPLITGEWVNDDPNNKVMTIFYHGLNFSQTHMAAYTREFISDTNEIVSCKSGIDVILHPFIGKEIAEVIPKDKTKKLPLGLYLQNQFSALKHWYYDIAVKATELTGNLTISQFGIDRNLVNIGGERDVEEHRIKYNLWKSKYPNSKCILYGVSRGAATTFCAMAKHQYQDVSLVVLESCYGSIENVLKSRHLGNLIYKSLDWVYPSYDKNGKQPIDYVDSFPENVPVVFITSELDTIVPCENTVQIAQLLAARKRNKIYFLKLQNSYHSTYPIGADKELYYNFMHKVYRECGCSFSPVS